MGWSSWESWGGGIVWYLRAVSWARNRIDIFGVGWNPPIPIGPIIGGSREPGRTTAPPAAPTPLSGIVPSPVLRDVPPIEGIPSDLPNGVWHNWWEGGLGTWGSLRGQVTSNVASASWGPGRLDIFAVLGGSVLPGYLGGTVRHRWWDAGAGSPWSGWEDLGGTFVSGTCIVDAVSWGPGRVDVFAIGADKAMHHNWYDRDSGGWGGWESLGGLFGVNNDVHAVSWGPGRLDVFALGDDRQVHHCWYEMGTGWGPWEILPLDSGWILSLSAVCWGPRRIDLFASSEGALTNDMYHLAWDPSIGGWGAVDFGKNGIWGSLGRVGPASYAWNNWPGTVVAVSPRLQRLDVFGLLPGAGIAHRAWADTSWEDWELLDGDFSQNVGALAATVWQPDRIDLFAIAPAATAASRGEPVQHRWLSVSAPTTSPPPPPQLPPTPVTGVFILNQVGVNKDGIAIYMGSYPGAIPLSGASVITQINVPLDLGYGPYWVYFLKAGYIADDIGKDEARITVTSGSSITGGDLKSVAGFTPKNVTVMAATSKLLAAGEKLGLTITYT